MTAKQTKRKKDQDKVHELHEKYYGKKKARQEKEELVTAEKKAADVAPGQTIKTGVDISGHPNKDNGKHTRAELMAQAQAKGIKYFRILHRDELEEVLRLHTENQPNSVAMITDIQVRAKKRWKAGWSSLKNKKETPWPEKKKEKQ